jgi:Family of unknown function (DUF5677)
MPTEPYLPILDRERSKDGAREVIELAAPLLREVVNHASWALHRCQAAADEPIALDEGVAPFILYQHAIEAADGAETLIREGSTVALVPVVRTEFEATLGLEYVLQADTSKRALSWLCAYLHERLTMYTRLDSTTHEGRGFHKKWRNKYGSTPNITASEAQNAASNLVSLLAKPHLAPIEVEYNSQKAQQRRKPAWYALFDGPKNLAALAEHLNRGTEYDALYRPWSRLAHAGDFAHYILHDGVNSALSGVRNPNGLRENALLAVELLLRSTRLMINHFREGESLKEWYLREVRQPFIRLADLRVRIQFS